MTSRHLDPEISQLPLWCDGNRGFHHTMSEPMAFRGPDFHAGAYVAVYVCEVCGAQQRFDRDEATHRPICIAICYPVNRDPPKAKVNEKGPEGTVLKWCRIVIAAIRSWWEK